MFCSNCGNKLNEDAKFCTSCGNQTAVAAKPATSKAKAPETWAPSIPNTESTSAAMPAVRSKPKLKLPANKFVWIGFIAAVVVVAIGVSGLLIKPAPTIDKVDEYLLSQSDISPIEVEEDSDVSDWTDGARIFDESCSAQKNWASDIKTAKSWGNIGFTRAGESQNYISLSHQIVAFPSEDKAKTFMEDVLAGSNDKSCLSDTPNPDTQTISEKFGINLDGVYMALDFEEGSSVYGISFARRANVISIMAIYSGDDEYNLYDEDVTIGDLEGVMETTLKKFNG